ncbi:nucleic acid-binding protein [Niveomyces insectorum RCEF 264]|uniref:Nucleic acid-binding protein n=1 Tax=Niveomyces insectorum RCEF 264 TaxID=1081102 RepID=A0A167QCD0_9HYPO|nr:nucleic acid-binding protein [Niveomyces insectorum RCEF 264]
MESTDQRGDRSDAVAEGRRIYLGNLLYAVKPHEVEQALTDHGFGDYAQIHISVDPVSGRNPGYCFVDFHDRATAEGALTSLSATVRGRPLKVGPCEPKQQRTAGGGRGGNRDGWSRDGNRDGGDRPAPFQRWGDWKRSDARGQVDSEGAGQGPSAALDHFHDVVAERQEKKRLFIGGLGKMIDQDQNFEEITELLAGFHPTAIGKRITAHESMRSKPGNHNYCFVDFATEKEASDALDALNGKPYQEGTLQVSYARGHPDKSKHREGYTKYAPRATNGDASFRKPYSADDAAAAKPRALDSSNWRRKED